MALSPQILQWAQTPEAQPYIAKYLPTTPTQSMGGMGTGGMDTGGYGSYLVDLINANQANPDFQQQMLGEYLDFANPLNLQQYNLNQQQDYYTQQELGLRETENMINTAISLSTSDDPVLREISLMLLTQAFPKVANTGYGVGQTGGLIGTQIPSYEEQVIRQEAIDALKDTTGMSREEYEWNRFLATAPEEDIRKFVEARDKFWTSEKEARALFGY